MRSRKGALLALCLLGCGGASALRGLPSVWVEESETMRFLVPVEGAPARGTRAPLVTVVVFNDYECPFCRAVAPSVENLRALHPDEVRVVVRHLPMPFHQRATLAAEAAEEARAQRGDEGFFAYQDRLLASGAIDPDDLLAHAAALGLSVPRFRSALERHIHRDRVERDLDLADQLGVGGTPTLFLNGRQVVGAIPEADLAQVLDEELALARRALDDGVPRGQLYALAQRDALDTIPRSPRPRRGRDGPRIDRSVIYRVPLEDDTPIRGPRDAPVTIVAFSDFQCPFCGEVNDTLLALREAYPEQLRIAFRHLPLSSHRDAHDAAAASIEAFSQGGDDAFWRMHDRLFAAGPGRLGHEDLFAYARELGLDEDAFRQAILSGRHHPTIERDRALALRLGQRGTPTFYVNGRLVAGSQPLSVFREAIEDALLRARVALDEGASPENVYDAVTRAGAPEALYSDD